MDLDAYITEHDGEWRRLAQLTRTGRLTADETDEMLMLYQRASTHLSMVRSRMPDPILVARLSQLVLAARAAITGGRPVAWREAVRFVTHAFPAAVYRARWWWVGTAVGFVVVTAALIGYIAANPQVQTQLAPPEAIRSLVDWGFEGYYSRYQNQNFALQVWTNNARAAGMALVGGVMVVPTLWVLWQNALGQGTTGGLMIGNGRADLFFGLIAPHGLLELSCFMLAAGVGLRIGWSWIVPRAGRTRGQSLAEAGRSGLVVAMGLVPALAVAGLLEGFVTPNLPSTVAIPIGVAVFGSFVAYTTMLGRRAVEQGHTGDLSVELGGGATGVHSSITRQKVT